MPNSHQNIQSHSARYRCLEYLKKNSLDLYLCYCGSEACDPTHSYGPEVRTEYLLHIILKGSGTYTVGNTSYHLRAGQVFLICPGITTYYEADKNDPWHYVWVGFNGIKATSSLKCCGLTNDNLICNVQNPYQYEEYVNQMLNASKLTYANDLCREGYLYLFISSLIAEQQQLHNNIIHHDYSYQVYVDHTLEFIEHNYDNDIKISDIANYIGINRSYLTTCFKKIINMSPQEYLLNYRMNLASILLRTTDYPINDISNRVGYTNPLTFSKTFKCFFNLSPKSYRNHKEEIE